MILISTFTVPIGWTVILRRTCRQIYRGQCFGWAAALAYYSFLALFPALLFVVSVASFLPLQHVIDQAVEMIGRFAPGDVVAIVHEQLLQITDQPHTRLLALSLVGTIWSMSSGMVALIGTLNQAHHIVDGRSWWRIRATAIALTGASTLFMVLSFTLAMVGPTAAEHVANWLNLGATFTIAWQIVRWPAAFALAVTAIGGVYRFAPDVKREFVGSRRDRSPPPRCGCWSPWGSNGTCSTSGTTRRPMARSAASWWRSCGSTFQDWRFCWGRN